MTPALRTFSIITLLPVPLIAGAALWGGAWAAAAVLYLTALAASLDGLVQQALPADAEGAEFPAADALSVLLALSQFGLLALAISALSGDWLTGLERAGLFVSTGWFLGQVGHPNAHELIHRPGRSLRQLGRWVYISMLFGHHASAHPLVHHVHVATPRDPNSARLGQTFYGYLPRAWVGSFRAGLRAETERLTRAGHPLHRHPYVAYVGGAVLVLILAALIGGPAGALWMLALAGLAQAQILMSDYVQHYGLRRRMTDGKAEPVGDAHSWNSPHWFTSGLMLNAPRHSDHHAHPSRPYPALRLTEAMPTLPRSLPVMGVIALWPPAWRRIMDPRVRALTAT